MKLHKLFLRFLYIFYVFTCSCTEAQEYGYDLDNIVITEGATNPTENIDPYEKTELTKDQTLDLVIWNVDWLGDPEMVDYEHGDRNTHIRKVASEMIKMDADIYALQEVVVGGGKGNALDDLVSEMNEQAGNQQYAGKWSEYHSYYWEDDNPDFPPQCLAYVWNTNVVTVNRDTALLNEEAGRSDFASGRLPYLLDAHISLNGKNQRYMIVNLHLKAFAQYDYRRKKSVDLLRDHLNRYYFENNVVVAGDFNVATDPGALGEIAEWGFYDDHEEDGLTDYVHAAGRKSDSGRHNIDHILISNELFDELAYVPKDYRNIVVRGTHKKGLSSHDAYMTRLYVHEETGGDDPAEGDPYEVHMRAGHYQMIVDYVNDHELPNSHAYPENSENYFGASAYYSNFDIEEDGSWNMDAFDNWQEAVQTAISHALLPELYPDAVIDNEVYTIYFNTYNGNTESTDKMNFICTQAAPGPAFEKYEGPVNGLTHFTADNIRVYPNPVRNNKLNIMGIKDEVLYKLMDMKGKTLLQGRFNPGTSVLSLENIRQGCYFLLLKKEGAKMIVKQIIK